MKKYTRSASFHLRSDKKYLTPDLWREVLLQLWPRNVGDNSHRAKAW